MRRFKETKRASTTEEEMELVVAEVGAGVEVEEDGMLAEDGMEEEEVEDGMEEDVGDW